MAHKNAVSFKADVEFFVKKAGKSFGVEINDLKGNLITKLYGSLNRNIRNSTLTIGDMIEGEKVVFDAPEKRTTRKSAKKAEKVEKRSGRSLKGNVDVLAKNIANAFAQFGA